MAWTAPMTAVANAAFTAAQFNTHVRDNLNETAPAKATTAGTFFVATGLNSIAERQLNEDSVAGTETTTSASFTDLATPGPSVTVTTSSNAIVMLSCQLSCSSAGGTVSMSFEVSGASTVVAATGRALEYESSNANDELRATRVVRVGLTAGSNVFTAKYATSTGTGSFGARFLLVLPL